MSTAKRQMHLGVFVLGTGNHSAGWRYEGAATSHMRIAGHARRSRASPSAASSTSCSSPTRWSMEPDRPPVVYVPVRADDADLGAEHDDDACRARRDRVDELQRALQRRPHFRLDRPYQRRPRGLERRHQLEREGGAQLQPDEHQDHELRYERAEEFVDVVRGLWDCWDDGAIVADKKTGQFIDADKVRPLNHKGRFFKVQGPVNMARCPQGHPVIIQAGGSPPGWNWRRAPPMSCSPSCRTWRRQDGLCRSQGPHGEIRPPSRRDRGAARASCRSSARAMPRRARSSPSCKAGCTPTNALTLVASRIGYDVSRPSVSTGRCRRRPPTEGSRTFDQRAVRDGKAREHDPARSLQSDRRGARPLGIVRHAGKDRRHARRMVQPAARRMGSTCCRPISRARSTTSSISSCRNCSAAACSAGTTRARRLRDHFGLRRIPAPPRRVRQSAPNSGAAGAPAGFAVHSAGFWSQGDIVNVRRRRVRVRRPHMRVRRLSAFSVNRMIPNVLTLLALCAGMTAIRFAINGKFEQACSRSSSPGFSTGSTAASRGC